MSTLSFRLALLAGCLALSAPFSAQAVEAVASIKPVQSLLAGVMRGTGEPKLIVEGAGSPHSFAMKPSHAKALQNARLVVWVGPELEVFLKEPLEHLGGDARILTLADAPGISRLDMREGGAFEQHDHDHEAGHEAGHDEHDDHDHGHDDKHAAEATHDHDHEHGEEIDPHFWLDPANAMAWTDAMAEALIGVDPDNAALYRKNADQQIAAIKALQEELSAKLSNVAARPFIVFHDGYHYFEERFGLQAVGSITVSPEKAPGAKRLADIRHKIEETGAVCVFAEPQFEPRVISVVTEGTNARTGTLDPLGANLQPGPDLYPALMRQMADSFDSCLSKVQ